MQEKVHFSFISFVQIIILRRMKELTNFLHLALRASFFKICHIITHGFMVLYYLNGQP